MEVLTILPDDAIAGSLADVRRQPLRKIRYYLWALWRTWSTGLSVWSRGRRGDVLFIQKVIFPAPIRRLLRCLCAPIVYDFDDAIFTTEVRSGYWLSRLKEARNASGVPAMLALAKLAIVENDYTGDFARRHCDVLTITGPIDTAPYDGLTDSDPTVSDAAGAGTDGSGSDESGQAPAALIDAKQRPLVLGWIGSPSTVTYLDLIAPVLCRLARHYPLRLCVTGADFDLDGVEVECRPWSLDREAADLRACDIGLMPVPDDPWTRGKGGYKLLQYMACGLPVVAHPVGINVQIVTQGDTGFLQSALCLCYGQSSLLQLGLTGRKFCQTGFRVTRQSLEFLIQWFQLVPQGKVAVSTEAKLHVLHLCCQRLKASSAPNLAPQIVNLALDLRDDVFEPSQICLG